MWMCTFCLPVHAFDIDRALIRDGVAFEVLKRVQRDLFTTPTCIMSASLCNYSYRTSIAPYLYVVRKDIGCSDNKYAAG